MTDTNNDKAKHKARMQDQKAKVDERIAAATQDKGLLLVITGNGKVNPPQALALSHEPLAMV